MFMLTRISVGPLLLAMAVGVPFAAAQNASAQSGPAKGVTTAPVIPMRVGDETRVSGTVVPYREVTLAAQLPGEIKYLAGEEGDSFNQGTVVVAVDDENIRAKRRAAVASFMSAQAAYRNAHVQYNRELWSPRTGKTTGFGFPMMMDDVFKGFQGQTAGANRPWVDRYANIQGQAQGIQTARSKIIAARAQIDELDAKLRDAQLKVPFKGKILQKLVEVGDTVQPGQPLIKFGDVGHLRIQAEVPVRLMQSLKLGMVVDAHIDVAGGQPVPARVAQIFPMADATRHTVKVKFDLPDSVPDPHQPGRQIAVPGGPGMYAEISVVDRRNVRWLPTVPRSAIVPRGSLKAVMVLGKDGKSSLRMVRLGDPVAGGRVAVMSGLKGDEKVITGPPETLSSMQSGMAANIRPGG